MDEISINAYVLLCEQYNTLAQSFYQQHLDLKSQLEQLGAPADFLENPILANAQLEIQAGILQTAICAVVFEAFAASVVGYALQAHLDNAKNGCAVLH